MPEQKNKWTSNADKGRTSVWINRLLQLDFSCPRRLASRCFAVGLAMVGSPARRQFRMDGHCFPVHRCTVGIGLEVSSLVLIVIMAFCLQTDRQCYLIYDFSCMRDSRGALYSMGELAYW